MNKKTLLIGGILGAGIVITAGVAVLAYGTTQAFAQAGSLEALGYLGPDGPPFGGEGVVDRQALLADGLGISVEELEAAQQAALEKGVAEALEAGKITEEDAERILSGERPDGRRGLRKRFHGGGELLADELGITVEKLEEARMSAHLAAIDELLVAGVIDETQASNMQAGIALAGFIDREAIFAEALGISTSELEAAKENGTNMRDLLDELGLDKETIHENIEAAMKEAIDDAVAAGVITREQADALQEREFRSRGEGRRGDGGFPGGPNGQRQGPPEDVDSLDA